jgi:DNA repair photolyase
VVEVILRERKPPVLTPSSLPCLRDVATINLTQGCALGCRYCYIQGYSHYPGESRVILYINTPEVVEYELRHKRQRPRRVYFSPSSDAFQYLPQVQDVSRRTMAALLENGVEVAFLTKGFVSHPFFDLFANHANRVFAQIGITTLDRELWRRLEPRTAPPHMRLAAVEALVRLGVATTVRVDPLIPSLTDTDDNLLPLLHSLSRTGVRDAAASYLFLRPQFASLVALQIAPAVPADTGPTRWPYQRFGDGSGGGQMLPAPERALRFARLHALGEKVGIRVRPCRCKNPELGADPCGITGPGFGACSSSRKQVTFNFGEPSAG